MIAKAQFDDQQAKDTSIFIVKWKASGASERANFQPFILELCDLLGMPRPEGAAADDSKNDYVFERPVTFRHNDDSTSTGFIDLYKKGCFVCEGKQGSDKTDKAQSELMLGSKRAKTKTGTAVRGTPGWVKAMARARGQAESYAKALPADDGWPPIIITVDVGHCIEVFADFTQTGKAYTQFPDRQNFRIVMEDLAKPEVQARLKAVWTNPLSLDPARISARVTREIAERLAKLTKTLEGAGHAPEIVAGFLMRCLFTMFAEDVGLLKPANGFTDMLTDLKGSPDKFQPMAEALWNTMDKGGFSPILREDVLRFNGGLFSDCKALSLNEDQLHFLTEAAKADWKDVEPAIFGTLLEQALDPRQRHDQGMHYTPRAYVERLVMPTVIEPLREDWEDVKAAAVDLTDREKTKEAIKLVAGFHQTLCATRVLDPACGSGNFLYVTMEHMKRLEGEVLDVLSELGHEQYLLEIERHTVDPHQFLGIEINPRAAVIAELVLWIGYLQWHFNTRGRTMPAQPVLKNFKNIECRDAILAWDEKVLKRDEDGKPKSRWDGVSMKEHPVTGEQVPDETKQMEIYEYINPRKTDWPEAEFIVGNPPFIGNKRMRMAMGDGYVDAVRNVYKHVSKTVDYVMYWWFKASQRLDGQPTRQVGFVSTNSLSQPFNRVVLERAAAEGCSITFTIPDHPWIDGVEGAAVRISMTVMSESPKLGNLFQIISERKEDGEFRSVVFKELHGRISPRLSIGADTTLAVDLLSNRGLARQGLIPLGEGFRINEQEILRFGYNMEDLPRTIRHYRIGSDLVDVERPKFVIDFFRMSADEARESHPSLYQHLLTTVKPKRDLNKRPSRRDNWWIFGENASTLRPVIESLDHYIGTCRTAKHRVFRFLDGDILPDAKIVAIGLGNQFSLGVLSSRVHLCWAERTGVRMGVGNDLNYNHADCFAKFPFPDPTDALKDRIHALGEQLDTHRKERLADHESLTMTGMYNVLEKLRAGEALTDKEKLVHEQGLVSLLKQIHDELDAAVLEAYGWPLDLSDDEVLERLVALNNERAAEEKKGVIRWLRPDYQDPDGTLAKALAQGEMDVGTPAAKGKGGGKAKKTPWPTDLPKQFEAVRDSLASAPKPMDVGGLAKTFSRAKKDRVEEVLATLVALGKAREVGGGRYTV